MPRPYVALLPAITITVALHYCPDTVVLIRRAGRSAPPPGPLAGGAVAHRARPTYLNYRVGALDAVSDR